VCKLSKVIVISGPTASGKTQFAIDLAQQINGAIISADSMQVYKGLDIGTAKATLKEMAGVAHHLIDIVHPDVPYSVADFQRDARTAINEIMSQGQIPIIVGGTGLYIQSLVFDYVFDTMEPLDYARYDLLSTVDLAEKLRQLDPLSYDRIDKQNRRRLLRAVALAEQTDQTKSEREAKAQSELVYDVLPFALMPDRAQLYERINQRADAMIAAGLVAEVQYFNQKFVLTEQIKQAIGYRETLAYCAGAYANEAAYKVALAQQTRRFAKRQVTWLKNQRIAYHFLRTTPDVSAIAQEVVAFLHK